jgi:signal transduction histidine kinase
MVAAWELADWPILLFIISTYIGLALGWGWFGEVRQVAEEQQETKKELRLTHAHLRRSHADLKLAQWKLIEAEKLEAVGQLAAGVAHEVKNPLMTLLTGTRYLKEHAKIEDENVRMLLDDMLDAVERADSVITGLLDFSAPRELELRPTDLNDLVKRSAKLVQHELNRAHVSLRTELAKDIPPLMLDGFKIQQVLVNLFTNAAHATPKGGVIVMRTCRTDSVVYGADSAQDGVLESGRDMVILQVDDTGTGIAPEQLSKLYDPFFTTKPTGKGTGLGLAVTRQIVDMHGGKIDIRNRDTGGARVTVVFNVLEEVTDGEQEAHTAG